MRVPVLLYCREMFHSRINRRNRKCRFVVVIGTYDVGRRLLVNVDAGLLKADEALKSYDGLFTNEFVQ